MAIWEGRSRLLGLPIRDTSYQIQEDMIFIRKGYLANNEEQVLLYRVRDVSLKQGVIDRLFNQGTITLFTSDPNNEIVTLLNIENPREVRDTLNKLIEKEREKHQVISREFVGYGEV